MLNISLIQSWIRYLRNQRGVETLEWILIGGLLVGVGIILYPGILQTALTGTLGLITGAINTAVAP